MRWLAALPEPFAYSYMARAIWVSALVGGVCAFLSCYLVLKGWSLMGDALSHAVLPVVGLALARRRDLFLVCFDPGHARAIGLDARRLEVALLVGRALVIVAALSAAGIFLVVAMLIAPGAIGFVATKRFDAMMAVAAVVSIGASVLGVLASFHIDVATAPLIVVMQAACFLPALWFGKRMR